MSVRHLYKVKRNVRTNHSDGRTYRSWVSYGGPFDGEQASPGGLQSVNRLSYDGWVDSDWKYVRRTLGYLPTRHYTLSSFYGVSFPGDVRHRTSEGYYNRLDHGTMSGFPFEEGLPPNGFGDSTSYERVVGPARIKALLNARDLKTSIPVAFAEGRETVRMFKETAEKLYKAYKAFRRGSYRTAANLLGIGKPVKGSANNWLQYQYGWSPLVADLVGLAELAAQQLALGGRKPRFRASGYNTETGPAYSSWPDFVGGFGITSYGGNLRGRIDIPPPSYIGKAWLYLEVEYSSTALASQLGFGGFSDILSVAWELIPFSFVADWIVNVGNNLEAMSALSGLKVLDAGEGCEQKFTIYYKLIDVTQFGWYKCEMDQNTGPFGVAYKREYSRQPWDGNYIPALKINLSDPLNARRITSLGALFVQLFK